MQGGRTQVSSSLLAETLGVSDAQVRKDLGYLGNLGHPGIGYAIPELIRAIRRTLGIDREWNAALVGVGNLARALLHYRGFMARGFHVAALFDSDPAKVGQELGDLRIHPVEEMAGVIAATHCELGLLCVPSDASQAIANAMVAAGVKGLLNFAPGVLQVPPGISVVSVDLTVQLEQLAFLVQLNDQGAAE